jgi:hypothetical protein
MGFGFKRCVGQLPTGASNNMSVEPTTLPQGRAVLGSGFDLGQEQVRQQHRGRTHSQPIEREHLPFVPPPLSKYLLVVHPTSFLWGPLANRGQQQHVG